ncbi:MAG TPA: hypothetical protein VNX01_05440, partial [Bacteroidia bacterium]|nr:hypothetical protein [Bacteroidia bacterium]
MIKKILLAAFLFLFIGIKAQTNDDQKLLLQGFDEAKVRKELTQQGLNADEHIDRMRRSYMAKRSKELGLVKVSVGSHNDANHANTARNGNQHNTTLSSTCSNSSFQQLNFSGWSGNTGNADETANNWFGGTNTYTAGIVSYAPQPLNSPLIEGAGGPGTILYNSSFIQIPTTNRHNIMNTPPTNNNPSSLSGYDSLAINPTTHLSEIPFVSPNGSGTSMRLGNANAGGETESITYSISVTSATTLFTYQYAVVLNNPAGGSHTPNNQPAFIITTKDQ